MFSVTAYTRSSGVRILQLATCSRHVEGLLTIHCQQLSYSNDGIHTTNSCSSDRSLGDTAIQSRLTRIVLGTQSRQSKARLFWSCFVSKFPSRRWCEVREVHKSLCTPLQSKVISKSQWTFVFYCTRYRPCMYLELRMHACGACTFKRESWRQARLVFRRNGIQWLLAAESPRSTSS